MYIVLGATGHVGSAVANALVGAGERVIAIVRDAHKAASLRVRGMEVAAVDVCDVDALRETFKRGGRAFLLNPPAPPPTDTDAQERRTLWCIAEALAGSGLEKVVVASTYGAQSGQGVGDLGTLFDFEQAVARQSIPATVLRSAYYMSNWDLLLDAARKGSLPTKFPPDLVIPMVAPADIGGFAAELLRRPVEPNGIEYAEGPARYSPTDVAAAFSRALGRDVQLAVTPRAQWEAAYRNEGFSASAAASYAGMTAVTVDGEYQLPATPLRGETTLTQYVDALVRRQAGRGP